MNRSQRANEVCKVLEQAWFLAYELKDNSLLSSIEHAQSQANQIVYQEGAKQQ
jgi:hypothetical protein